MLDPVSERGRSVRDISAGFHKSQKQGKPMKPLTSAQFIATWYKYDKNRDGSIEGKELDRLLKSLMKKQGLDLSTESVQEYKSALLSIFDANNSGTIELFELAEILTLEENFLLQFQAKKQLSSAQFVRVFAHYDSDKSGYLDAGELKGFVWDLLSQDEEKVSAELVEERCAGLLQIFDVNGDNQIDMRELSRILPVEQSFLVKYKGLQSLTEKQIQEMFDHYDQNHNSQLEDEELRAFLYDLLSGSNGGGGGGGEGEREEEKKENSSKQGVSAEDLDVYEELVKQTYVGEDGIFNTKSFTAMLQDAFLSAPSSQ